MNVLEASARREATRARAAHGALERENKNPSNPTNPACLSCAPGKATSRSFGAGALPPEARLLPSSRSRATQIPEQGGPACPGARALSLLLRPPRPVPVQAGAGSRVTAELHCVRLGSTHCCWPRGSGSGVFPCSLGPWLWALGGLPSSLGSSEPPFGFCTFRFLIMTLREGSIKRRTGPGVPSLPMQSPAAAADSGRGRPCRVRSSQPAPIPGGAWGSLCSQSAQLGSGQPRASESKGVRANVAQSLSAAHQGRASVSSRGKWGHSVRLVLPSGRNNPPLLAVTSMPGPPMRAASTGITMPGV